MEDFLKKLNLSDETIEIYLKSLGFKTFSYYELFSINPKLSPEVFEEILKELIKLGLLYQINFQNPNMLPSYIAIQPNKPILSYFSNIKNNFNKIEEQINEELSKSIRDILSAQSPVDLKNLIALEENIRKDYEDEGLIFKNDIEDAFIGMDELKKLQRFVPNLNNEMIGSLQLQISKIIKDLDETKSLILDKINSKEFKQSPKLLSQFIKDMFEKEVQLIAGDLSAEIENNLSNECEKFEDVIDNTLNTVFQHKNDLKLLSLNMLSSFEFKLNRFKELINTKTEEADESLQKFEAVLNSNIGELLSKSLNDIKFLNTPVIEVLEYFRDEVWNSENVINQKIWLINSITKINEEIVNIINIAKKSLKVIVPNLDNYLSLELFHNKSGDIKIQIYSNDSPTHSAVKEFQKLDNVKFNQIDNKNFISIVGDNKFIATGLVKTEVKNPLDDFVGFGSNDIDFVSSLFPNLITIFGIERELPPTIKTTQIYKPSQESPASRSYESTKYTNQSTEIQPTVEKVNKEAPSIKAVESAQSQIKASTVSKVNPKENDQAAIDINYAFNQFLTKVDTMEGSIVSKELQNLSDLILEKKGFSTVLHKIRSISSKFKNKKKPLNATDKAELINNIEDWKVHLFS